MQQIFLIRHVDETECARRNALTNKPEDLSLSVGSIGTVVDVFGEGDAYLVEFGSRAPNTCDWLGVLYASEIQPVPAMATAA